MEDDATNRRTKRQKLTYLCIPGGLLVFYGLDVFEEIYGPRYSSEPFGHIEFFLHAGVHHVHVYERGSLL